MAADPITGIANALTELTKVIGQWLSGATGRRSRKAIEAAEDYIRRNNKLGAKNDKLLRKYEKRFWANNN